MEEPMAKTTIEYTWVEGSDFVDDEVTSEFVPATASTALLDSEENSTSYGAFGLGAAALTAAGIVIARQKCRKDDSYVRMRFSLRRQVKSRELSPQI
mmetsp:Transcript_35483/g.43439  ORF Transcript_35483/g.43439 Transcript_35483/m.43439 type:complete len:97 (-) Transcript_35483:69-359(-)